MKYADLSVDHDSDYVFDLDRMLALTGNTGPYMQYADARIRSIFRAAGTTPDEAAGAIASTIRPSVRSPCTCSASARSSPGSAAPLEPHRLCGYLFGVARAFSTFYESCPVLKADPATRASRLALCGLTVSTIVTGLDLLGLEAPQQM